MQGQKDQGGEGGFTLLELIISLALFALIAVAGMALLDSVLKTQDRTDGRLERTAELQRAMFVVQSDLDQITQGNLTGGGAEIAFTRAAAGMGGPPVAVRYGFDGANFIRLAPHSQQLLSRVSSVKWRFLDGQNWIDHWPPDEDRGSEWPLGVEFVVQVTGERGPSGTLRRVVALPARAVDQAN